MHVYIYIYIHSIILVLLHRIISMINSLYIIVCISAISMNTSISSISIDISMIITWITSCLIRIVIMIVVYCMLLQGSGNNILIHSN